MLANAQDEGVNIVVLSQAIVTTGYLKSSVVLTPEGLQLTSQLAKEGFGYFDVYSQMTGFIDDFPIQIQYDQLNVYAQINLCSAVIPGCPGHP